MYLFRKNCTVMSTFTLENLKRAMKAIAIAPLWKVGGTKHMSALVS